MGWRTMIGRVVIAAWVGCGCASCGGTDEVVHVECAADCECLAPGACLSPWPSNRYLEEDPTTGTGHRLALPEGAMLRNAEGAVVDPGPWNELDGFSAMSSAVVRLGVPIDPSPLPCWGDDAPGLAADSPTVLLDTVTGERVAHFAEVEEAADRDLEGTTLYVRPAARLEERRRYVVAIRGLRALDGAPVAPTDAFRAMRDGLATDHAQLEARRAGLEADVFAPLAAAGVERADLILAWDFTTGSGESAWRDLLHMATAAFEIAGDTGIACAVTANEDSGEGYRVVDGTFTVPLFLASTEPGAPLSRDAMGQPAAMGTMEARFRAVVPASVDEAVRRGEAPASVVVYGHGLFDTRTRVNVSDDGRAPPVEVAERCGDQVWVATDFLGMAEDDLALAAGALLDLTAFDAFYDRVRQGLINTLLLPRTFAHQCAALPELQADGAPLVDPSRVHYYGNSQGSILGATLAALSPDIERYALGVGGISYPIMLPRSINWERDGLASILAGAYPDRFDRDLAMAMFASRWDLVEGAAFAPHVLRDPLPGARTRPARILYQVGAHDVQTPNVASEIAARTLGLAQLAGDPVWGLESAAADSLEGYVAFDVGAAPVGKGTATPTEPNGVHEAVRRLPEAQDQVCRFFGAE